MRRGYYAYSWFWSLNGTFRAVATIYKSSQQKKGNSKSIKKGTSNIGKAVETVAEATNITAKENQHVSASQKLDLFRFAAPMALPVNEFARKEPKYIPRKQRPSDNAVSGLQERRENRYSRSSTTAAEGSTTRSRYHNTTHRASASKNSTSAIVQTHTPPTEQKRNEIKHPKLAGLRIVRLS
ncbi:hypothetical protein LSM04_000453 [Trypanosoma melophagium]|uniref:uncharacterized protein n=1 Tax=Trypanosoma melophagium TaxID=715481 RepID=UPI003519DCA4|nr:hypothetical protein LSM04_000453 [Trypanosoma melophagium]